MKNLDALKRTKKNLIEIYSLFENKNISGKEKLLLIAWLSTVLKVIKHRIKEELSIDLAENLEKEIEIKSQEIFANWFDILYSG